MGKAEGVECEKCYVSKCLWSTQGTIYQPATYCFIDIIYNGTEVTLIEFRVGAVELDIVT